MHICLNIQNVQIYPLKVKNFRKIKHFYNTAVCNKVRFSKFDYRQIGNFISKKEPLVLVFVILLKSNMIMINIIDYFTRLLKGFRTGEFGKINLDHHEAEKLNILSGKAQNR